MARYNMKKSLIVFGILIILLILPFAFADEPNGETTTTTTETGTIDSVKACLNNKIQKCSDLTPEEKIFSSLAVSKCTDELIEDAKNEECWPKENCDVKTTAQALFALSQADLNMADAEKWLISDSHHTEALELEWYLQIDSSSSTKCEITYGTTYNIEIKENKKINSDAGSCLTLASGDYWLKVSPNCYNKEFSISCDKTFYTSLLYKKAGSLDSELYVPKKLNSGSAGGTTKEKVNSLCFEKAGSCDYESTLWAILTLDYLGYDTSDFIPYLILMADENEKYLPESFLFLYSSTKNQDFKTNLLAKQKESSYWDESGQQNYDTAIALLGLQRETDTEITDSKTWLLENQDSNGCWGGIRDTAFLIFSGWGKIKTRGGGIVKKDSCLDLGGVICLSDETCDEIEKDSLEGKCCLGKCEKESVSTSNCEIYGGICKSYCDKGEESIPQTCELSSEVCCKEKAPSEVNYTYIWILVILIVLVIIGILFRNKLRRLFSKGKGAPAPRQPRGPGMPPSSMPRMPPQQRRVFPRQAPQQPRPSVDKEFNEVLQKLKKMGK